MPVPATVSGSRRKGPGSLTRSRLPSPGGYKRGLVELAPSGYPDDHAGAIVIRAGADDDLAGAFADGGVGKQLRDRGAQGAGDGRRRSDADLLVDDLNSPAAAVVVGDQVGQQRTET